MKVINGFNQLTFKMEKDFEPLIIPTSFVGEVPYIFLSSSLLVSSCENN
ncbi:hypothetical protein [uncultured Mediterranean phage uvMED]|nr:hypothetical protein [uncultured Mediterranean phage uvMED]